MFLDNAATVTSDDVFVSMTDRELLEYNARTLAQILVIADSVKDQVQPVIDSMGNNPMLKMLFPKR